MDIAHVGGALTGGTTVALTPVGNQPGKSSFVTPDHTRLEPQTVEFTTSAPVTSKSDPGTARSGLRVAYASRTEEEGCCTVKAGQVVFNLGGSWALSQPEAVVDAAWALFQALVMDSRTLASLKKGVNPT